MGIDVSSGAVLPRATAALADRPIPGLATKPDLLCWTVWILGLVNVWRIQVLYPTILAPLRLGLVFTGVGLIAWAIARDPSRSWPGVVRLLPVRLMLLFFGIVLLGVPLGIYPGNALTFLQNVYVGLLLYFLFTVASVRSREDVERLLLVHLAGATIYSLVVLTRFEVGASGRLSNLPVYDANDVAMFLVCTMPIAVYFMRKGAPFWLRLLMVVPFVLFTIILVRSGSRGGFIGFLATMTYLLLRFKGIPLRIRGLALVVAIGTIALAGTDRYWELMRTLLDPKEDYNYTEAGGRKEIWRRGIGYMFGHPIAGVGVNNFGAAEGEAEHNRERVAEGKGWIWAAPHNSFVQVGAETGVFGLLLFVVLIGGALRFAMRRRHRSPDPDGDALRGAFAGALIAYCTAGFFLSQGYSAYLYSLLGLMAGMMKIETARPPLPVANAGGGARPNRPAPSRRARA